jgi:hypothetical protein
MLHYDIFGNHGVGERAQFALEYLICMKKF